jgi:NitT/TauT family transport system ATP-binding protein
MAGSEESMMGADTNRIEIEINDVSKEFEGRIGKTVALQNVSFDVKKNEFVSVVGPSGCGKSTILNIIAGLTEPSGGTVKVGGKVVMGPGKERGVVFQQYALFPWKTVIENVAFGLKLQDIPKRQCRETAEKYLELVGLKDFRDAYPKELSGGMKQRVAIARAYAVNPEVLLMDEPFGALDAQTRVQLQENLLSTWENERKTCFFITHDVEEAVFLAQRIIVMSARPGRLKEIIEVDLPYPRVQEIKLTAEFNEIKNRLWAMVYKEYLATPK